MKRVMAAFFAAGLMVLSLGCQPTSSVDVAADNGGEFSNLTQVSLKVPNMV